jgi:oxygen-independent coproporphyrinogen-3 oxidase
MLADARYIEIGMDHFALPEDGLFRSAGNGSLHRNFMGYTTQHTGLLLGLGCSSISDTWTAFGQNLKEVEEYEQALALGQFPLMKGHELTPEDLLLRRHILNLMCRFETSWENEADYSPVLEQAISRLEQLQEDGLVELSCKRIKVTEQGRPFLRNICLCLDARFWRKQPDAPLFSRSV